MINEPVPEELQKLRDLSRKIQKLMKQADVAGMVNLQGKGYGEFAIVVDPSWSVLRWHKHGPDITIRFKCAFATGTPEEKEMGRLTVSMIHGLLQICGTQHDQLDKIRRILSTKTSAVTAFAQLNDIPQLPEL